MPKNKNFQLRIEILDEILGNNLRRRTLPEILELLNSKLKETAKSSKGGSSIKVRTLYDDLRYLEEEKGAPIHRATKTNPHIYYTEKFSLKNVPIADEEVSYLRQAIDILKQATDLSVIEDVEQIITKLENKVHTQSSGKRTLIAFEEHTKAIGHEYINELFTAIREKCTLKITYRPFGQEAKTWVIHPYLLKEYRNRWFLMCRKAGEEFVMTLALDRIKKVCACSEEFRENDLFDPDTYFSHLIGVTKIKDAELEEIILLIKAEGADYIRTKPIHQKTQKILETFPNGSIKISLRLNINPELISYLLSYGPRIEVLKPLHLKQELKSLLKAMLKLYN